MIHVRTVVTIFRIIIYNYHEIIRMKCFQIDFVKFGQILQVKFYASTATIRILPERREIASVAKLLT